MNPIENFLLTYKSLPTGLPPYLNSAFLLFSGGVEAGSIWL